MNRHESCPTNDHWSTALRSVAAWDWFPPVTSWLTRRSFRIHQARRSGSRCRFSLRGASHRPRASSRLFLTAGSFADVALPGLASRRQWDRLDEEVHEIPADPLRGALVHSACKRLRVGSAELSGPSRPR
jgi:hypothetical protein